MAATRKSCFQTWELFFGLRICSKSSFSLLCHHPTDPNKHSPGGNCPEFCRNPFKPPPAIASDRDKNREEIQVWDIDSIYGESSFQDSKTWTFSLQSSQKSLKKSTFNHLNAAKLPHLHAALQVRHWGVLPAQRRSSPRVSDSMEPSWD